MSQVRGEEEHVKQSLEGPVRAGLPTDLYRPTRRDAAAKKAPIPAV